ncbi:uncharacterized protein BCR38DRAFT_502653 [Pseudomassariella vexata]|uniref:T6SS Phospholipase effector Tle1-like catalytic domain-containing protein n=1 Tax=Pseudomassariella vexata TaxID=1141098 RepID=A0A1Y2EES8_9PEZI|nr:uncharacterized protein BCR38DRAFT_502653 [Pseudomassariella vexata]ORY69776.1 hypothetical protein BCR38DRAFT_502653 [Pseudomassariella vexata]
MTTPLPPNSKKRIIVCCDGTWQNSDNGYVQPNAKQPVPTLQIPSNVTRISRSFARTCSDGTFQVIYYQSGVGSRTGTVDRLTGGAFGVGISENIREAYSYVCANYVDGDDIILIGFSRGAFTARSVAGMIADLGLLTREGMEYFYPVFKDMQHWMNDNYQDQFPGLPFPDKPKGVHAEDIYREKLLQHKYTRVYQNRGQGELITVKAVGIWYNTNLSHKVEHAFHALALDESRGPFTPTIWERLQEHRETTDLRQCWFPGSHINIGGGWEDQGVSNMSLAWMMDQLSSVDVEFTNDALDRLFDQNVKYYENLKPKDEKMIRRALSKSRPIYWAIKKIHDANNPIRPWSLHTTHSSGNAIYKLVGDITRTPGLYKKINPNTGQPTKAFLEDTNERIHSSVRVRLACQGLGADDKEVWKCLPLLELWRPRQVPVQFHDPIPDHAVWGPNGVIEEPGPSTANPPGPTADGLRWVWEYIGPEEGAPTIRTMVEENMGPYEKHLLKLSTGKEDVVVFADEEDFSSFDFPERGGFKSKIGLA